MRLGKLSGGKEHEQLSQQKVIIGSIIVEGAEPYSMAGS